ncbi:MAG TPA: hypothetical protein VKV25_03655 [Acidimicrobiales bacterium]|nr:hypothetical protein [Acidimicrobiales bacterium]
MAVPPGVAAAVVAGVVAGVAAGTVAGVVAAVVGGGAVTGGVAGAVWKRAGAGVADMLGGEPADPRSHARLLNVVEGLCTTAGVRPPELRVRVSGGVNLAVAGRDPGRCVLVVTSGLLEHLSRVELEGAVAAAVVRMRRGDVVAATVAAVTGAGVGRAVGRDPDLVTDLAAVRLTRYPPGLQGALEACARVGTAVPGLPGRVAHLWFADPVRGPAALPPYRCPLEERVVALSEL